MKRHICIQSSYTPEGWKEATFNDLACRHAGRNSESFFSRMAAAVNELKRNL
jgi:hypothetical protein